MPSTAPPIRRIFTGTFVHTPELGELEVLEDKAVFVEDGGIVRIVDEREVSESASREGWEVVGLGDGKGGKGKEKGECRWWFPGFVGE